MSNLEFLSLIRGFVNLTEHKNHYQFNHVLYDSRCNDRILIFASNLQLECLSKSAVWHVDGTFKTAPSLYKQVYTVAAWYKEEMHNCAHILLTKKEKDMNRRNENPSAPAPGREERSPSEWHSRSARGCFRGRPATNASHRWRCRRGS